MSVPRPWIVAPSMLARGRRPASHDPATCWLCTLDPVPPHGPGHGRPSRWTERAEVAVLAVGVAAVAWLVAAIAWGVGWEASGR